MKAPFIYLNKQGVKSSKGFIVQRIARHQMQYQENNKILIFGVEDGIDDAGKYNLAIYTQRIKYWQPPDGNEAITDEKKKEIIRNIIDALDFMKIGYTICEK